MMTEAPYNYPKAVYNGAKQEQFSVEVKTSGNYDLASGIFKFYHNRGKQVSTTATLNFYVPKGQLYTLESNKNPILRFHRFMSFLPYNYYGTANSLDVSDFSYMRAEFKNLRLYHRKKGWQTWNMNDNRIEYAWSVQTANISPRGSGGDVVEIFHQFDYHSD